MNSLGLTLTSFIAVKALAVGVYPDPTQTPGEIDKRVTQENIATTICTPNYTKSVRNVQDSVKKAVIKAYAKIKDWPDCSKDKCRLDHLIPLELGGSTDLKNLWPEFYCPADKDVGCLGAREKDYTQNGLHRDVCDKKILLKDAQTIISKDWVKCYRDLKLQQPCTL